MSRFPNSMERMAEEGSRRAAEERRQVYQAYEKWLDWATQSLPEGANLSLAEAYFAGWYERHRAPVTESMAGICPQCSDEKIQVGHYPANNCPKLDPGAGEKGKEA